MSDSVATSTPTTKDDVVRRKSNHKVTTLIIVVTAVVFIALLGYGLTLDQSKLPTTLIDKPAAPFQVSWLQGQPYIPAASSLPNFKLEDLKGRPVVLNFWASWCVSCREEARELQKFWEKHGKDVLVVGIAIQDEPDAALKFAQYFGKTYALGLDVDGKAAIDYGVSGVPETFLLDKNGVIRHKEIGPINVPMLEQLIPKISS
jgi:cytochrome c biogenesis protein CcmG/thiol:disulfide interchange protein DsbE